MIVIQIGANIGRDAAMEIIAKNDAQALLVEPNSKAINQLRNNYSHLKKIKFSCVAVSDYTGTLEFYVPDDEKLSEHASQNLNLIPGIAEPIKLPCVTLSELLFENELHDKIIDYLFIDTEGNDAKIILSTDFSVLKIQNIIFEHIHTDGPNITTENFFKCFKHLSRCGYSLKIYGRRDTIAFKS